jgi:hypothetical protein
VTKAEYDRLIEFFTERFDATDCRFAAIEDHRLQLGEPGAHFLAEAFEPRAHDAAQILEGRAESREIALERHRDLDRRISALERDRQPAPSCRRPTSCRRTRRKAAR